MSTYRRHRGRNLFPVIVMVKLKLVIKGFFGSRREENSLRLGYYGVRMYILFASTTYPKIKTPTTQFENLLVLAHLKASSTQ